MSRRQVQGRLAWLPLLALALLLPGCSATAAPPGGRAAMVPHTFIATGQIGYLERVALAPGMQVEIEFLDAARAGAPAIVVDRQIFTLNGRQLPVPFRFEIPRSKLSPSGRYSISARLRDPTGAIQWRTTSIHAVDVTTESVDAGFIRLVRTPPSSLPRRQSYECEDGLPLVATFLPDRVIVDRSTGLPVTLPRRVSASGFLYETSTHAFSGQGTEVRYRVAQNNVRCRAAGAASR